MIKPTKEEYFQYAKFLKKLSEKREGDIRNEGVCELFHRQFTTPLSEVIPRLVIQGWEHFSGCLPYPVPSCNPGRTPPHEFQCGKLEGYGMWSGEYGYYRRLYALYLANYFEDLVNEK